MFASNGILLELVFSLIPNVHSILLIVLIMITTAAGYIIFFRRSIDEQLNEITYARLLSWNFACAILSQYLAIIICIIIGLRLDAVVLLSEFPLKGFELFYNRMAAIYFIGLCIELTFISNFFIAFRKIKQHKYSRLFISVFFSIANGGSLLPLFILLRSHLWK